MNWDRIEGNWKQFKGRVKEQWGKLTDDDIDVIAGKRDQLVGKIQEQYGITKDEAEKQVDRFGDRLPRRRPAQVPITETHMNLSRTMLALFAAAGLCLAGGANAQTETRTRATRRSRAPRRSTRPTRTRASRWRATPRTSAWKRPRARRRSPRPKPRRRTRTRRRRARTRVLRVPTPRYEVAKEKCDDLTGNQKDVCVKEAKAMLREGEGRREGRPRGGRLDATTR